MHLTKATELLSFKDKYMNIAKFSKYFHLLTMLYPELC
jgi:hypothetical protein